LDLRRGGEGSSKPLDRGSGQREREREMRMEVEHMGRKGFLAL